ncbi:hypothetical protein DICA0_E25378 [Diutina catenulata]
MSDKRTSRLFGSHRFSSIFGPEGDRPASSSPAQKSTLHPDASSTRMRVQTSPRPRAQVSPSPQASPNTHSAQTPSNTIREVVDSISPQTDGSSPHSKSMLYPIEIPDNAAPGGVASTSPQAAVPSTPRQSLRVPSGGDPPSAGLISPTIDRSPATISPRVPRTSGKRLSRKPPPADEDDDFCFSGPRNSQLFSEGPALTEERDESSFDSPQDTLVGDNHVDTQPRGYIPRSEGSRSLVKERDPSAVSSHTLHGRESVERYPSDSTVQQSPASSMRDAKASRYTDSGHLNPQTAPETTLSQIQNEIDSFFIENLNIDGRQSQSSETIPDYYVNSRGKSRSPMVPQEPPSELSSSPQSPIAQLRTFERERTSREEDSGPVYPRDSFLDLRTPTTTHEATFETERNASPIGSGQPLDSNRVSGFWGLGASQASLPGQGSDDASSFESEKNCQVASDPFTDPYASHTRSFSSSSSSGPFPTNANTYDPSAFSIPSEVSVTSEPDAVPVQASRGPVTPSVPSHILPDLSQWSSAPQTGSAAPGALAASATSPTHPQPPRPFKSKPFSSPSSKSSASFGNAQARTLSYRSSTPKNSFHRNPMLHGAEPAIATPIADPTTMGGSSSFTAKHQRQSSSISSLFSSGSYRPVNLATIKKNLSLKPGEGERSQYVSHIRRAAGTAFNDTEAGKWKLPTGILPIDKASLAKNANGKYLRMAGPHLMGRKKISGVELKHGHLKRKLLAGEIDDRTGDAAKLSIGGTPSSHRASTVSTTESGIKSSSSSIAPLARSGTIGSTLTSGTSHSAGTGETDLTRSVSSSSVGSIDPDYSTGYYQHPAYQENDEDNYNSGDDDAAVDNDPIDPAPLRRGLVLANPDSDSDF